MTKKKNKGEAVVLVHGIWSNPASLVPLAARVKKGGYTPHLFGYNSVIKSPAENAKKLATFLDKMDDDIIHLAAHSLGGIVLKHLMHTYKPKNIGHVLMMATPINGSDTAREFNSHDVTKLVLGRATEQGLLGDVPPWPKDRPLGMVAGNHSFGLKSVLKEGLLEGPNDGTVKLSETMSDEVTHRHEIPFSHTVMLLSNDLADAVLCYLNDGNFDAL